MRCVAAIILLGAVADASTANPIRKVVTMLQNIQKKVEQEGKTDADLYEKFMCYCKTGAGDLESSITAAEVKIPQVESAIKEADAGGAQLAADLKAHKEDRSAAKSTMEKASSLREKQAKAYASMSSEATSNIEAIAKAVSALEKGMGGASFLQSSYVQRVRDLYETQADVSDLDREAVLAFLAGSAQDGYVPQSGQITGLLKQLGDEMSKNLKDATEEENAAKASYEALMTAKTKEVEALTAAIEEKSVRQGETAVNLVEMKKDLKDTKGALAADKKFLANLETDCSTKEEEWAELSKKRAQEQIALADTIKLLNDDDALELFKKVLPSAAASFVQVQARASQLRQSARAIISAARSKVTGSSRAHMDLIMLALQGKGAGFAKVVQMIDTMIGTLKTEQDDDDKKKSYCAAKFDETDDSKKSLERSIADAEAAAEDAEETIAKLSSEIKALQEGISALDKSVKEATEQRQAENKEFTDLMASNTAAVDLIGLAKNRLNKFYSPKLYVPPPKRELSEEDRIAVNLGGTAPPTPAPGGIAGTGITAFVEASAAPPAPPQAPGAFKAKGEESRGVIAMMDLLIKDLEEEMTVAQTAEKDAQRDYEELAADAAQKRAEDSSDVTAKEAAKANAEGALQTHTDDKASATQMLMELGETIQALHGECDWLLQYYDARKEARTSEVEALGKAKAVLSGADYSLLQTRAHHLRGN